jgi:VWFA-related protein
MARTLLSRRPWPLLSVLLLGAGISAGVEGDLPAFTFRANTDEVRLTFAATDQNDHGVATLQANDFVVVDQDIIVRQFQSFTRCDWTRLEIAILADNSESVTPQFRQELANIVDLISQTGGVPEENLSLFGFHDAHPALVCAGNCRSSHSADRLPAARAGQLTPLFDSVVFAADFLSQHGDAKTEKALIVFSDGIDTISINSLAGAIESSLKDGVEIYAVDLHDASPSVRASVLCRLATATGGRYFHAPFETTHILNVILDGFRATYQVDYRLPSHKSGFHSLRVLPTHNLNLEFRSRSGYYYPNQIR